VPSFIFLEATLGFFNIKSTYPSWGRIIYEGLTRGALYGSPFWVLEPIFLLLLTSFAFAMLGSALERILNPRMIDIIPTLTQETKEAGRADNQRKRFQIHIDRRAAIGLVAVIALVAIVILFNAGRRLVNFMASSQMPGQTETISASPAVKHTPTLAASSPTLVLTAVPENLFASTLLPPTATMTDSPTLTPTAIEPTLTPTPVNLRPLTYTLHQGEFPYCIARRFNVDPNELLAINRLAPAQTFYAGMLLQIPQSGNIFPGNRTLQVHPTTYLVSLRNETIYSIACSFGDIDPDTIAQVNNIPVNSILFVEQQLKIP
jgi:LysM repeat protein